MFRRTAHGTISGIATRSTLATTAAAVLAIATMFVPATADAQDQGRSAQSVPPGHMPPPGQCRVWHDGLPPGQQPPPMSCATARRDAARTGGRVIYGDERRGRFERVDRFRRDPYPDARYPATLPDMVWGVIFGRGRHVDGVRDWLGSGDVQVEYTDSRRRGVPEVVTWRDSRGTVVQRWYDDSGDGRADRVVIYQGGRAVRVIR